MSRMDAWCELPRPCSWAFSPIGRPLAKGTQRPDWRSLTFLAKVRMPRNPSPSAVVLHSEAAPGAAGRRLAPFR
jgi:hypothetical protein